MKRLLLLAITLTWVGLSSHSVLACTCAEYQVPVCAAYWRADAVFVGLVSEITPPSGNSGVGTVHFIVEQPFRGVSTSSLDVQALFGTSCDIRFVKGTRYLVYASGTWPFAAACGGTTDLRNAADDLEYIRSVTQQGVTESLAGRVARFKFEPIAGVKIQVRNESRSFETTADENGDYSVALAGPGTYTVRVLVPSAMAVQFLGSVPPYSKLEQTDTLTTIEYKVELRKSECDYREFDVSPVDLHATAAISGTVVTASGRPVQKGYVHLLKGEAGSERFRRAEIKADGSFTFENVTVGEYFLVLNPDNKAPGENDPPYGRAFFPNAKDASDATRIVVAEGAKLENLTLRVGPAWKARTVSGRVVWQEGVAVRNAGVTLYDGNQYLQTVKSDGNGRFSFEVYGDFKYVIQADVWGERRGISDRVVLSDKSTNLTLVLKPN